MTDHWPIALVIGAFLIILSIGLVGLAVELWEDHF